MAVLVALLPVSVFLLVLVLSDSFKLVSRDDRPRARRRRRGGARRRSSTISCPGRVPAICHTVTRYIAPVTEETLKALFVLYAAARRQIGFLVDAAIIGFAVGTGFALVENIEYLSASRRAAFWLWVARGFGTAMLHAITTALVAIAAKSLSDRIRQDRVWLAILPGLLAGDRAALAPSTTCSCSRCWPRPCSCSSCR